MARRATSNAPSNMTEESLGVVVRQVGVLLNKPDDYVQPVINALDKMAIRSCDALDVQLYKTLHNRTESEKFTQWFQGVSDDLTLSFLDLEYLRCCSMYMNACWKHDQEYFQRMIEWEKCEAGRNDENVSSGKNELVGALITNMREFMEDEATSDDDSMPGLQDRARSDSSSSDGSSMPFLQSRALEDSSSGDDTMSCGEDGLYDDGEHCAYGTNSKRNHWNQFQGN